MCHNLQRGYGSNNEENGKSGYGWDCTAEMVVAASTPAPLNPTIPIFEGGGEGKLGGDQCFDQVYRRA